MYCGQSIAVEYGVAQRVAHALKCRAWSCPDCAPQRRRALVAQACGGRPDAFLTLTSRRQEGVSPDEAARDLTRAWRILRKRIMRRYSLARLPFLAVMEATQTGWPHLHILLRSRWLDQRWLSEQMADILDSPVVGIERIDKHRKVAVYVAKYVGKAPHRFAMSKRYHQSRDYDLRPRPKAKPKRAPGEGWEVETRPLWSWVADFKTFGWCVEYTSLTTAVARAPP